jgi:thiosulfate dehydrogenase [quinone] large subunit
MTARNEQRFAFVFRIYGGLLFLHTALAEEVLNPRFVATHVVPVLNAPGLFHWLFSPLATPTIAPVVGFLASYGHLLIGVSLLVGLLVRLSASIAMVLLVTYSLVGLQFPDLQVVNHATALVPVVLAYRVGMFFLAFMVDYHILMSIVLVYIIMSRASHIMGLDAWAVRVPFLARLRVFG